MNFPNQDRPLILSLVIPTKNRPEELLETARSVVNQTRRPNELVIVDQSTRSWRRELLEIVNGCGDMEVKYLWVPEVRGLVPARKKGLLEASGDIVFFVDDDITLAPDCVEKLLARYSNTPELGGLCAVDTRGALTPLWLVLARRAYMLGPYNDNRSLINKWFRYLTAPQKARLFSGGYMSFRRAVFQEFQFEDNLWGHRWSSSIDFSYRVSRKHLTIIDPHVHVFHRNPDETYDPDKWVRIRVAGAFFFFHRNVQGNLFTRFCLIWLLLAIFVRSMLRGMKTKQLRNTIGAYVSEVQKGFEFLREPFLEEVSTAAGPIAHAHVVSTQPQAALTICIVIPTKNRLQELVETVRTIASQVRRPDELVIVDQSDRDCETELRALVNGCHGMTLKYIWDPRISGLVAARIRGVKETSCEVVFFVDDDVSPQANCVASLAKRYQQHPEYAGICAVDIGGTAVSWWLIVARRLYMLGPFHDERSLMNKRCLKLSQPRRVRFFSGGWMSYRRWIFNEFQFEARLWGHRWNGSVDLSYRVSKKYPLVIDPMVKILHRLPYGMHTPEEFVRIRVSGTFFFFARNVKKDLSGWICFALVILAIFIRTIWRGIETRAIVRTFRTFLQELRRGVVFLRHPFPAGY